MSSNLAAIDCGSLSTRLLVSAPGGRPLVRIMRITGLSRGVDASGHLAPASVRLVLDVLAEYRAVMDKHDVAQVAMVGTSALRDSSDREQLCAAAQAIVGVPLQLLPGETEAALSFIGASGDLPAGHGPWLMLDIGGGSTELAIGPGPGEAVSLDVGCVRLSERHLHGDPPAAAEMELARRWLTGLLQEAQRRVPALRSARSMVGLAGTVSALACWAQSLPGYRRELVHHYWLTGDQVRRALHELSAVAASQRAGLPGIEAQRAAYIVGGALVLAVVMEHFGFDRCLVSEADILDGLVHQLGGSSSALSGAAPRHRQFLTPARDPGSIGHHDVGPWDGIS